MQTNKRAYSIPSRFRPSADIRWKNINGSRYLNKNTISLVIFQDPRYKDDLGKMIGYKTDSLLCMPIKNAEGDVIGVAQVINKNTASGVFSPDDEKVSVYYW